MKFTANTLEITTRQTHKLVARQRPLRRWWEGGGAILLGLFFAFWGSSMHLACERQDNGEGRCELILRDLQHGQRRLNFKPEELVVDTASHGRMGRALLFYINGVEYNASTYRGASEEAARIRTFLAGTGTGRLVSRKDDLRFSLGMGGLVVLGGLFWLLWNRTCQAVFDKQSKRLLVQKASWFGGFKVHKFYRLSDINSIYLEFREPGLFSKLFNHGKQASPAKFRLAMLLNYGRKVPILPYFCAEFDDKSAVQEELQDFLRD